MNSINNVVYICQPSDTFSVTEIESLIPMLEKITRKHENNVCDLLDRQRFMVKSGAPSSVYNLIDNEVARNMVQWGTKLAKLGGKVLAHGYVGFDGGGFYYSWHYGESRITHYHLYNEHPFDRKPIKVEIK